MGSMEAFTRLCLSMGSYFARIAWNSPCAPRKTSHFRDFQIAKLRSKSLAVVG
jgi:hypothetical protein